MSYKHFREPEPKKKRRIWRADTKTQKTDTGIRQPSVEKSIPAAAAPPLLVSQQNITGKTINKHITKERPENKRGKEAWVVRSEDATHPIAISFSNVTKVYQQYSSERKRFFNLLLPKDERGEKGSHTKLPYKTVYANRRMSFVIRRGESVVLLGRNGAGKSTALKMITGVIHPTQGNLVINGKVSGLLELTAGFDGKLTGVENIRLRAQIAGLSTDEIEQLIPQVVDFAELGDFVNKPFRTYSSGMKARLGFAMASSVNPDILLVDEALSVGDAQFQKKCRIRVKKMLSQNHLTAIFVTHSFPAAKQFCKRGIVIDEGRVVFDGLVDDAIAHYKRMTA
jgi:teichoic acid transport system ATP-binding protein